MNGPLVVVAGALASKPENGGEAWARLSWLRGLERLGCRVAFVEELDDRVCVDPFGRAASLGMSLNLRWFKIVTDRFGLTGRSCLVGRGGRDPGPETTSCRPRTLYTTGPHADELLGEADLLVNISGNLSHPRLRSLPRRRVYVDLDPGFTQMWHGRGPEGGRLAGHDLYFTVGLNVGTPDCPIHENGVEWRHVLPPVVLADWPVVPAPAAAAPHNRSKGGGRTRRRFTTVATWRSPYGPVEWEKRRFGLKVHELGKYVHVPRMVDASFEAALAVHPSETDDLALLSEQGWEVADPRLVAGTTESFRRYVTQSDAEFSVAQEMYVSTGSGWFSDRTTCYLATGRPALVQDTGFSRHVAAGKGLVAFSTPEEAAAGARYILSDYAAHAAAARAVAEECFDSDRVLAGFLESCGLD